ncbi:MAG: hypothetical protein MZV64_03840 [Ignavibacteriales bacterium]|nr:hypothetical protein [Ignavibacteriales bacterium]
MVKIELLADHLGDLWKKVLQILGLIDSAVTRLIASNCLARRVFISFALSSSFVRLVTRSSRLIRFSLSLSVMELKADASTSISSVELMLARALKSPCEMEFAVLVRETNRTGKISNSHGRDDRYQD